MRVTNEQAVFISSHFKVRFNAGNETNIGINDLASDLLDARALIKEMRMVIYEIIDSDCECESCKLGRSLLERSKEYEK